MPDKLSHRYYVYILFDEYRVPFYVGKGQGKRVSKHEQEAKRGHKCHKCNKIRQIWSRGGVIERYIAFTTDDERMALDYEIELIRQFGRNNLTNETDGGQGLSGHKPSPETTQKRREKAKAQWADQETRAKMVDRLRAAGASGESSANRSAGAKRWADAETPEARKQRYDNRNKNQSWKDNLSAALVGREITEATREKIRQTLTGRVQTDEQKKNARQGTIDAWARRRKAKPEATTDMFEDFDAID